MCVCGGGGHSIHYTFLWIVIQCWPYEANGLDNFAEIKLYVHNYFNCYTQVYVGIPAGPYIPLM